MISSRELEAFHRRVHLLLPAESLMECPCIDFGGFSSLRWLRVNEQALTNVISLTLSYLPALETLELASDVGWNKEKKERLFHDMELFDLENSLPGKTFCVRSCPRLKRVAVGGACFCDYEAFEMTGGDGRRFFRRVGRVGGSEDRRRRGRVRVRAGPRGAAGESAATARGDGDWEVFLVHADVLRDEWGVCAGCE